MRVLVMASGQGSNFRALASSIDSGRCAATLVGLVTDQPKAGAVAIAHERNLPVVALPRRKGEPRRAWGARLADAMETFDPELIVLAGFMRVLDSAVVSRFAGRIINIHPALLPAFPGLHAPEQALEAGVRIAGCTVHIVDEGVDSGPILAQGAVEVLPGDSVESLHARIQRVEHELLPQVVDWIGRGLLTLAPKPELREPTEASEHKLVSPNLRPPKASPSLEADDPIR